MNNFPKSALACAIALMLAACGGETSTDNTRNPTFAATTTAQATAVSKADYYAAMQHIYVAYFGRPADPAGLDYFAGELLAAGAPTEIGELNNAAKSNARIKGIIDIFSLSQESQDLYGGDNGAFIDAVYTALFNRTAEEGGRKFWVDSLNSGGLTRADAALQIMVSALGTDVDIVNNKTSAAATFTTSLDLAAEQRGYSGLDANVVVRNMLAEVGLNTDLAAFQTRIDQTAAQLAAEAPPGAEGGYHSKLANVGNTDIFMHVLNNDEYYTVYGVPTPSKFSVYAFGNGTGLSGAVRFTSNNMLDYGSTPPSQATVDMGYTAGQSMNGAIHTKSGPLSLQFSATDPSFYNYGAAVNVAAFNGEWRMEQLGQSVSYATISSGSISGQSQTGCTYSGSLAPHASGKNAMTATLTFGSSCSAALAGKTTTGVALSYLLNQGATRQIIVMTKTADRATAALLSGSRATSLGMTSTVQTQDLVVGTGAAAQTGSRVTYHYTTWLYSENGTDKKGAKFETSKIAGYSPAVIEQLATTNVNGAGFEQSVVGMKVGGTRRIIVPFSQSKYAAEAAGTTSVPGGASLVYEIEMVAVQ